jgi:predicted enzyme related to lactoylglutathione lyase
MAFSAAMPMTRPQAAAVLYAKNLKKLAEFYAHVTRLRLRRSAEDHIVLECESFQLVVVQIPKEIAERIEIEEPPVRRSHTPVKLVFFIEDLEAARNAASSLGGALNPAGGEWLFDGDRVCDGHDPEGNVFQLRQTWEGKGGA